MVIFRTPPVQDPVIEVVIRNFAMMARPWYPGGSCGRFKSQRAGVLGELSSSMRCVRA